MTRLEILLKQQEKLRHYRSSLFFKGIGGFLYLALSLLALTGPVMIAVYFFDRPDKGARGESILLLVGLIISLIFLFVFIALFSIFIVQYRRYKYWINADRYAEVRINQETVNGEFATA